MSDITRRGLHEEISRLDTIIEAANSQKADQFDAYRDQLKSEGKLGAAIKSEIEAFKKAERRLRALTKNPDAVLEQDNLVDEIISELQLTSAAKKSTRARASREPEWVSPPPSAGTVVVSMGSGRSTTFSTPEQKSDESVAAHPDSNGEAGAFRIPPDTHGAVPTSTLSDEFNCTPAFLDRTRELRA